MSRVIPKDDNEISQDFEELMKNQNNNKEQDNSDHSDHSDKSDGSDGSLSIGSPQKENNQRDNQRQQQMMQQQMMQQQMNQQQMLQQQMNHQQMNQQRNILPQKSKEDSNKNSSPVPVKEEFTNNNSLNKTLTLLGVLFALFFVFASPQVGDALGSISYLSNLPFASHINLLIRALLFVVIYGLLERFVL
jgi:hypothetical protein